MTRPSVQDPRRTLTLRDVSEASGVSEMTVSRVLRNRGDVSETTRERVLEAARAELDVLPLLVDLHAEAVVLVFEGCGEADPVHPRCDVRFALGEHDTDGRAERERDAREGDEARMAWLRRYELHAAIALFISAEELVWEHVEVPAG